MGMQRTADRGTVVELLPRRRYPFLSCDFRASALSSSVRVYSAFYSPHGHPPPLVSLAPPRAGPLLTPVVCLAAADYVAKAYDAMHQRAFSLAFFPPIFLIFFFLSFFTFFWMYCLSLSLFPSPSLLPPPPNRSQWQACW